MTSKSKSMLNQLRLTFKSRTAKRMLYLAKLSDSREESNNLQLFQSIVEDQIARLKTDTATVNDCQNSSMDDTFANFEQAHFTSDYAIQFKLMLDEDMYTNPMFVMSFPMSNELLALENDLDLLKTNLKVKALFNDIVESMSLTNTNFNK